MSLSQLDDDFILLRGRLAERERDLAAVREAAADAAEAAARRLSAAQQEAVALRRALDEARALAIAEPEPEVEMLTEMVVAEAVTPSTPPLSVSPLPETMTATSRRRSLRRVMALPVWRLIRPVARPLLWRARSFLTADAVRELAALRAAHEAMQEASRGAVRDAVQEALSGTASPSMAYAEEAPQRAPRRGSGPSYGLGLGDTAAERWLLTVALECAPDVQSA